ncbi:MAG: hypothetical protein ABIR03_13070 [Ginsengibacter sp.]
MKQRNHLTTRTNQPASLAKPILIGAGIALIVISFFVFGVDEPHLEWGKFWMVRPLIITPLAGAWVVHFTHLWIIRAPAVSTEPWRFS